jgi:hypothetical protein
MTFFLFILIQEEQSGVGVPWGFRKFGGDGKWMRPRWFGIIVGEIVHQFLYPDRVEGRQQALVHIDGERGQWILTRILESFSTILVYSSVVKSAYAGGGAAQEFTSRKSPAPLPLPGTPYHPLWLASLPGFRRCSRQNTFRVPLR